MLPDLPKKHKRKEADFGLKFRKWISANPTASGTFELKDTRGKASFYFAELTEEQIAHALRSKGKNGNLIRVEVGNPGAPDYVYFRNAYAWIVIKFPKTFHVIDIETFLLEKKKTKGKYLSEIRAKEIAFISVN